VPGSLAFDRHRASSRLWALPAMFVALPWLLQLGLLLFTAGLLGDVAFHVLPPATAARLTRALNINVEGMHLALFVGMLAIVAGLFQRGLRHGR
jgi:hypothetical protein